MAEVMGKVINAPDLEYGQKRITSSGEIGLKGSWDNMVNIGFFINLKLYKLYDLLEQTFC
jgi:hypothetical protein